MSDVLRICGLWKHDGKDGKPYLAGSLGGVRVLVFTNAEKPDEKSPDAVLCVAPKPDERTTPEPAGTGRGLGGNR